MKSLNEEELEALHSAIQTRINELVELTRNMILPMDARNAIFKEKNILMSLQTRGYGGYIVKRKG